MALVEYSNYLAETGYRAFAEPGRTLLGPFGRFVHIPEFPTRRFAHQLFDAQCEPGQVDAFVAQLEACYQPTGIPFRHICGHRLKAVPQLVERGFAAKRIWMTTHRSPPARPPNPAVSIEIVGPRNLEEYRRTAIASGQSAEGVALMLHQWPRLGGKLLLARIDGRPAGCAGWYMVESFLRFRRIGTAPAFRQKSAATSLIHHVLNTKEAQTAEAAVLFCDEGGPMALYESLGFVRAGELWELHRDSPCR